METNAEYTLTEQHTLLFVDDEQNILNALQRVFRKEPYKMLMTTNPIEALRLIETESLTLVISDHRMPEMSGTEFLSRVREIKPDVVRIMLTGYADIKSAVQAINESHVYRFISKPWNDDDLRLAVRAALRQSELVQLNRELTDTIKQQNQELYDINRSLNDRVKQRTQELEEKNEELFQLSARLQSGLFETIRSFMNLMELKGPLLVSHSQRVAELSREVASRLGLGEEEQKISEMAALLMDLGTIGYSDRLLNQTEKEMGSIDWTRWQKHPLLGEAILKDIEGLQAIAKTIRHHHECSDGSGFPDGLRADRIPLTSRIVAAADFFDSQVNAANARDRLPVLKALQNIERKRDSSFDPAVVAALKDVVTKNPLNRSSEEREVVLEELAEGMVLSRNLKTRGGILLVPARCTLKPAELNKILSYNDFDPIEQPIYVFKYSKT